MKLTLEIDETIWQYELDKFNTAETPKIVESNSRASKQHNAVMAQTPVKLQTKFTPLPDFVPLSIEDYVIKILTEKETAIIHSRTTDHVAIIASQSPETIAKFAEQVSSAK